MSTEAVLILAATKVLQQTLETVVREKCSRPSVGPSPEDVRLSLERSSFTFDGSAALIEISLSAERRSSFSGIQVGQMLRRNSAFKGALIFIGFPSGDSISEDFSLLQVDVPGVKYLCAPFPGAQLCEALENTRTITEEELAQVVIAHCGIREEVRKAIHDLTHRLYFTLERCDGIVGVDAESLASLASEIVQLSASLNRYYAEQMSAYAAGMNECVAGLETLNKDRITRLLGLLDETDALLKPDPIANNQTESYAAVAPQGYENLFIADDDGFSEAGIQYLEACGYSIVVERSAEAATATLSADPGPVFLCDQTFGDDSSAGRRLMALARREQWKLIIALSGARLDAAEVPEADAICAGPLAKLDTGARRVHEIICEWATTHP